MRRARGPERGAAATGRTARRGRPSRRPSGRAATAIVALLTALLAAAPAQARSIHDPDIGWPTALREELDLPVLRSTPCREKTTRAKVRLQSRVAAREPRLRGILRYGEADVWGSAWYTHCDGGRLQIGIASGAPPGATRRIVRRLRHRLAERRLTNDVRLVAVRSTYRQLDAQAELVDATVVPGALDAGDVETSVATDHNAVSIDAVNTVSPADLARLHAYARDAPVNVVLHVEPPADPDAPIPTYEASVALDDGALLRDGRDVPVRVDDTDCASDETYDSAARFAGVRVRLATHAWILTARFRVNPAWPRESACEGTLDPRLTVRTTVRLPSRLGRRGIVDGAEGPGGFRPVLLEPVGAAAIRSLVPPYIYAGETCDRPAVRRAFRGRPESGWCFF